MARTIHSNAKRKRSRYGRWKMLATFNAGNGEKCRYEKARVLFCCTVELTV